MDENKTPFSSLMFSKKKKQKKFLIFGTDKLNLISVHCVLLLLSFTSCYNFPQELPLAFIIKQISQ